MLYTHRLNVQIFTLEAYTECCRLFQYLTFGGYCVHLPRDELTVCLESVFRSILYAAAAGNLHADYSYALYIVVCDNLCKLFGVVDIVELRTADYSDVILYKTLVEAAISICSAVGSDEKVRTVKIRSTYRNKLNLYRPLHKFTCVSVKAVETVVIGAGIIAAINMSRIFAMAVF